MIQPDKNGHLEGQRHDQYQPRDEPHDERSLYFPDFLRSEYGDDNAEAGQEKIEHRRVEKPAKMFFHPCLGVLEYIVNVAEKGNE